MRSQITIGAALFVLAVGLPTASPSILAGRPTQGGASQACAPLGRCTPLSSSALAWLKPFATQMTRDVAMHSQYGSLLDAVTPKAMYHFHVDLPLAAVLRTILNGSSSPVHVREDRYYLLEGCAAPSCTSGRAFVWVDILGGVTMGGIEFNPTNGEPTPTITLMSTQVRDHVESRVQLPAAFLHDFETWARATRLRGAPARYFINADGWKSVIVHDEEACQGADRSSLGQAMCGAQDFEMADQDMRAEYLLLLNLFDEKSPLREVVKADQDKWLQDQSTRCPGSTTQSATAACRLEATKARTTTIAALYEKQAK